MMDLSNKNKKFIDTISAPLGFFVLSLLIVETFIGAVLINTNDKIGPNAVVDFIYLGIGMFVLVVFVVTFLVWAKPTHLTFSEESHLKQAFSHLAEQVDVSQKVEQSLREASFLRGQGDRSGANIHYRIALSIDPKSEPARIGHAVNLSFMEPESLSDALAILDSVIEDNPANPSAYYNRACIRHIDSTNNWGDQWLKDLQKAIEIEPTYREFAKSDKDFDDVRGERQFADVLSG